MMMTMMMIIQIISQIHLCFVFHFSPVLACSGCYIWKYPWRMDHWPFGTQRHHHGVCFTFWTWLASHCVCSKSNDAVFWPCHQWHGMWYDLSCSSSKFWKYCEACWLFMCIKVHILTPVRCTWYYYYYPLVSLKYTLDGNKFTWMSRIWPSNDRRVCKPHQASSLHFMQVYYTSKTK